MTSRTRPNRLVITDAFIYGVYLTKRDPVMLEDQWRVTVMLHDLKDAIEAFEREHAS